MSEHKKKGRQDALWLELNERQWRQWRQAGDICRRVAGKEVTDAECLTMIAEHCLAKHDPAGIRRRNVPKLGRAGCRMSADR